MGSIKGFLCDTVFPKVSESNPVFLSIIKLHLRHVVPQIIASLRNKRALPGQTGEHISSLNVETSPTAYQDSLNAD